MEISEGFGAVLRARRLAAGLTQDELAKVAGLAGRTVRAIESKQRKPHKRNMQALSEALDLCEQGYELSEAAGRGGPVASPVDPNRHPPTHVLLWPTPPTSLVGREREVVDVVALLRRGATSLVTLTGPGGVGKTRLALRVAEEASSLYSDGAVMVPLASLRQTDGIATALARALGLADLGVDPILKRVVAHLRPRATLLVLDNVEHLLPAAGEFISVLRAACPRVVVLATSRALLHIGGEHEIRVSPLEVPGPAISVEDVLVAGRYAAVRLFVERARAGYPAFALTPESAPTVVSICQQLDGLPLAIELAAARAKLLPPKAILARLDRRLDLLTGGARDAPERLQGLRNAISWSYDLLGHEERRLFRSLAVFTGGCTLAAAAEVYAGHGADKDIVLDGLTLLLDQSMVQTVEDPGDPDGARRVVMLETLRAYGSEQLLAEKEVETARDRHAMYYLALAEEAQRHERSGAEWAWHDRLEQERHNLDAALRWLEAQGNRAATLRLAAALYRFWYRRGPMSEGRRWLERALVGASSIMGRDIPAETHARVLNGLGVLSANMSDYDHAVEWFERALDKYRTLGNSARQASVLCNLGLVMAERGSLDDAKCLYEQAASLFHETGDQHGIASTLANAGALALIQGRYDAAHQLLKQATVLCRSCGIEIQMWDTTVDLGAASIERGDLEAAQHELEAALNGLRTRPDQRSYPTALFQSGRLASLQGDHARAEVLCAEAVSIARTFDYKRGMIHSFFTLGMVRRARGADEEACTAYREALALLQADSPRQELALCFEGLGATATLDDAERAVRLWGAAARLRREVGAPIPASHRVDHEGRVALVRSALEVARLDDLWAEGEAMGTEEVYAYALDDAGLLRPTAAM